MFNSVLICEQISVDGLQWEKWRTVVTFMSIICQIQHTVDLDIVQKIDYFYYIQLFIYNLYFYMFSAIRTGICLRYKIYTNIWSCHIFKNDNKKINLALPNDNKWSSLRKLLKGLFYVAFIVLYQWINLIMFNVYNIPKNSSTKQYFFLVFIVITNQGQVPLAKIVQWTII